MGSMQVHEASAADGTPDQSRRDALKRFGRYAAAAPAVMVLLEPREGHAGKGKGRGWGKGGRWGKRGRRGNSNY